MLYWTIKATIVSVIFILIVHNIFQFLRDTLTVPKIRDLVNTPNEKYRHMYDILQTNNRAAPVNVSGTTNIDDIVPVLSDSKPTIQAMGDVKTKASMDMKNELKKFMKKQLNTENAEIDVPQYMPM